ncbi:Arc family DNA-binding protein [Neorhizobium sp. LjRoot104]|uniref:Arc family DNA-binding protein n=1 Tax=Neorhizobium sp. LjRoot104 TaxID=3342254 RepID=UPI003ECDA2F6
MKTCDLKIRLPEELKQWLASRAENNDRSLNGEILSMMKAAQRAEAQKQAA